MQEIQSDWPFTYWWKPQSVKISSTSAFNALAYLQKRWQRCENNNFVSHIQNRPACAWVGEVSEFWHSLPCTPCKLWQASYVVSSQSRYIHQNLTWWLPAQMAFSRVYHWCRIVNMSHFAFLQVLLSSDYAFKITSIASQKIKNIEKYTAEKGLHPI